MRQLRYFFKRHALTVMLLLFTGSITAEAQRMLSVPENEVSEIWSNTQEYVFVGNEISNLVATVEKASSWSPEATTAKQKAFIDRAHQGFKTAPKEFVLEVLADTCDLVEKHHSNIDDDEIVSSLVADLEQCCDMVKNDTLTIQRNAHGRAPREGEAAGLEDNIQGAEAVAGQQQAGIQGDGAAGGGDCCPLPRDVNVDRDLHVGGNGIIEGDLTVNGSVIIVGPITFNSDVTLQPSVGNDICIIYRQSDAFEKARICSSSTLNDKGLYISVDAGVTEDFRVANNGDTTLLHNLNLEDSSDAATGNIYKNSTSFIHNYGTDNTFVGKSSGNFNALLTGSANVGIGPNALMALQAGSNNIAVGKGALDANTDGSNNIAIGTDALGMGTASQNNTAIGYMSLLNNGVSDNTAVGYQSLMNNGLGLRNTAVGVSSLTNNNGANDNTAVGYKALMTNSVGINNAAFGANALSMALTPSNNNAFGANALAANTSGANNTAIGANALTVNGADNNTAIGYNAGSLLTTGVNNIMIGAGVTGVAAEANTCRIGTGITRTFIDGITGTSIATPSSVTLVDANGQLGTDAVTINLGTGATTTTINIGTAGDAINVAGVLNANSTLNVTGAATFATSVILEDPGAGTNTITLQAPNPLGGSYVLTLPVNDGNANDVLITNGLGVLSWNNATSLGYFINNGNSFGVPAVLGTNDAQPLSFETSGTIREVISTTGTHVFNTPDALSNGTTVTIADGDGTGIALLVQGDTQITNGNLDIPTTSATAGAITQNGGARILHTFGTNNAFYGNNAGNLAGTLTGTDNVGIGTNALISLTSGAGNVAIGSNSATLVGGGGSNTVIGAGAAANLTTGSDNIIIGYTADSAAATQNGIILSTGGVLSANNQIKIGFGSVGSDNTFIDGITGTNAGASADVAVINASGQLGTQATTINVGTTANTAIVLDPSGSNLHAMGTQVTGGDAAANAYFARTKVICAYITSAGVVSSQSGGISGVVAAGSGIYNITFDAFAQTPIVMVTPNGSGNTSAAGAGTTTTTATIETQSGGVGANLDFNIIIIGQSL